ncbi:ThiF family adenylyltransferase [Candidatus Microgenomates bacterium]|nr:ThiF family adenylyltransferase [Candidatus Microgenomates bacterium]
MTFRPDYSDQTGIFDPAQFGHRLTMIGCGGIGASALLSFATLGIPEMVLWDPDIVEPRNVASQLLFRPSDVLRPKVEVAREILLAYGVAEVEVRQEEFHAEAAGDSLQGIVVSGVDSMATRQDIWRALAWNPQVPLYLDGRIGGESFQLNTLDPCDPDAVVWYEQFQLFSDEEGAELPCTERAVVYPAVALGACMTAQIARYHRQLPLERMIFMDMRTNQFMRML